MPKLPLADLEQVVRQLIFPFYQIDRNTSLRFRRERHENDAEHSWSLALFACAFAPHVDETLDVGKVSQFAVVHDLLEVYTGDIPNFASDKVKALKDVKEAAALKRLQADYATFPWITETVTDYESQKSNEARFVKATDKLLLLLFDLIDEGLSYQESQVDREAWQVLMQKHREKAKAHPAVFAYYDKIWDMLLDHPEYFWPG